MADVDKIPIKYGQYITYSSGEGNEYAYGYYYDDPKTGESIGVSQDKIKEFKPPERVWDPNIQVSLDGEGTVGYGDYVLGQPSGYIEIPKPLARHRRDQLNQSAQKVYDQLVDQRDRIAAVDPNAANKLYGPHSDLTADEGMVLMAQELAESGITDIYKVKKETVVDKIPIKHGPIPGTDDDSYNYTTGYYYEDPKTGRAVQVNPNTIKDFTASRFIWDPDMEVQGGEGVEYGGYRFTAPSGYVEEPRVQYTNTETGQPLKIDQYGQYEGQENILQSRGAADRVKIGYGIDFTGEGIPTYFQTAYKEPSSWKSFTNALWSSPIVPIAASLIGGPIAGAIASGARAAYGPGDLSDALKAAALSFGMSTALEASGIKGLLGGAAPEFDITDVVPPDLTLGDPTAAFGGMPDPAFGDPSLGDPTAGYGGMPDLGYNPNLPPGEAGIQQILSEAAAAPTPEFDITDVVPSPPSPEPEFDITDVVPSPPSPEPEFDITDVVPSPPSPEPEFDITDVVPPDVAPEPEFDITDVVPPDVAPEPEFDITDVVPPDVAPEPEFDITDVVPPDADPTLGDPTAAPGGMPPLSVGDQLAIAGMTAGGSLAAFAGTPLGRLALSLGGSALLNKVFEEEQGGGAGAGTAGWSGSIPEYQMVRERVPLADAGRRPGEYGRRYFSDTSFVPITPGIENAEANLAAVQQAQQAAQAQAAGLASIPAWVAERRAVPTPTARYQTVPDRTTAPSAGLPAIPTYIQEPRLSYGLPTPDERLEATNFRTPEERKLRLASGGLASLAKGRYLDGPTDGMEDRLKATIEGKQPARLSHGEFVIPADVVSHLGNGNSQAGAKRLYDMMDKIRMARTGTKKQGKQINPSKYLPS